jgi:nucleoid-associated protein YgaU
MRILKETNVSIDGAQFIDPDDDTLTYSATGLPAGLKIDPTTGEISGQIMGSVAGELVHEITVTVDDGLDTASFTFKITPFDLPVIQPPNPITLPPSCWG